MEKITCKVCVGKGIVSFLSPGVAMLPKWGVYYSTIQHESDIISPDSKDLRGVTQSQVGSELGECMKCPKCGWSVR